MDTPEGWMPDSMMNRERPPTRDENVADLTEAAARLARGEQVHSGWLRERLLDLRDLLRA